MKSRSPQPGCARPSKTTSVCPTAMCPRKLANGWKKKKPAENVSVRAAADRAAKRQQALQQERERKYAEALAKLHAQYGTTTEDVERWEELLQDVQMSGNDSLYRLVADSHLLNMQEGTMLIGIPSQVNFTQISHPGLQTQLKRSIKRVFEQDVTLQFVLIDPAGVGSHSSSRSERTGDTVAHTTEPIGETPGA